MGLQQSKNKNNIQNNISNNYDKNKTNLQQQSLNYNNTYTYNRFSQQQGTQKNDPRYGGNILFYKYSQTALQTMYLDQQSKQTFTKLLDSRRRLQHQNFITVKQSKIKELKQFCSIDSLYQVQVEYQYQTRTLEDQISKYCAERRPFPENQLRSIFGAVVSVLQHLKENKTLHGDIKPTTIMVNGQKKTKIIDSYFINNGKISYQIVMQNPSSMSLLAPQQLQTLRSKKYATIQHIHQAQMWQVGLSMLQSMTAQPAMECYDLSTLSIKKHYFDKKLDEMMSYGYSRVLSELVISCVNLDKDMRPTFVQFLNTLKTNTHPNGQKENNNSNPNRNFNNINNNQIIPASSRISSQFHNNISENRTNNLSLNQTPSKYNHQKQQSNGNLQNNQNNFYQSSQIPISINNSPPQNKNYMISNNSRIVSQLQQSQNSLSLSQNNAHFSHVNRNQQIKV